LSEEKIHIDRVAVIGVPLNNDLTVLIEDSTLIWCINIIGGIDHRKSVIALIIDGRIEVIRNPDFCLIGGQKIQNP
jgi:hypothetical protein